MDATMPDTGVPIAMFSVLASTIPGPKMYEENGASAGRKSGFALGVRLPSSSITTAAATPSSARAGSKYLRIIGGAPYFWLRRPRQLFRHPFVQCGRQIRKCADRELLR